MKQKSYLMISALLICLAMSGCSLYIDSFTNDLTKAIESSNDPQTIMQALPAYIVLIDGMIEGDPQDEDILMASVFLMNAYSSLLGSQIDLIEDMPEYHINGIKNHQKRLNKKALQRAEKALCIHDEMLCNITNLKFNELSLKLKSIKDNEINILYRLGTAWVSWVQVNTDDWNAMAQLAQIKLILQIVIDKNDTIDDGNAHVYLAVLNSLIPATLGGKPEVGKQHFEAAIKISNGNNLMAKALYAEYYARLMFDEKLHKRLTDEIILEESKNKSLSLINTLAVEKAKALQRSASDYF
ncbi:hypothetical protein MNBD_GAMMA08-1679 [hydrothermal vent metagenome]|uniref:Uncharacterized protein n=1 Tax=hydrothermal vent metagenome TaxID=652676 RepID=A0A3B0XCD8_9ZZZZ